MKKLKQEHAGNWSVRMRCVVIKDVHCSHCTKSQAEMTPWNYADDEIEIEQVDWEVVDVAEDV